MADNIVTALIKYARDHLELEKADENYAQNAVLASVGCAFDCPADISDTGKPDELIEKLVAFATERGIIEDGEGEALSDTVMGALSLPPSSVERRFSDILKSKGSKTATDWLYRYCIANSYVKRAKLDKNPRFEENGLVITINKAKPEFRDPAKARAGNSVAGGYPKCVICRENEGYGPKNKRTLRTVSVRLDGEDFFWQYSPFGYFNEHGIAVNCEHIPMHVDRSTFAKLFDFVDIFPHYFIGCNAALPRIGGSVLAHDHFQGGGEVLPLHNAAIKTHLVDKDYPGLDIGILDWPGNVIRISSEDRAAITEVSEKIREAWVKYDAPELGIIAEDGEGSHNAVSPTVVKRGKRYEMNIILRSNITSEQYPDGVFHAHPEFHSIKKESIGLIEAQGLFILPGRLEKELAEVEKCISAGKLSPELSDFSLVYEETSKLFKSGKYKTVHDATKAELASICERILGNTAVFKEQKYLLGFLKGVGLDERI